MIKIGKPNFNLQEILDNCTSNMLEPRRTRINQVKSTIIEESIRYDELAKSGKLYLVPVHDMVDSIATKEDMEVLYTQKFVPENQENRSYYEKIKLLAPNSKCPYCGQNLVKTVDHYLPKSKYITYSVTPYNLVPSCSDCNKLKSASVFNSFIDQPLHPYYDDIGNDIWLKAKLIESEPISFEFYAEPPTNWEEMICQRVVNNFTKLELNNIYKVHASELYTTCFNRIKILYSKGGKALAINRLEENIEDEDALRANSWKSAMYKAIIDCDWYWGTYLPGIIKNSGNTCIK